jgi:hypothetical protein
VQGGLIARALFTIPDFDSTTVHTVITQATPHRMPVTALDPFIVDFYNRVNNYWSHNGSQMHEKVIVVSTGGGYRDILVRDGLTMLDGVSTLSIFQFLVVGQNTPLLSSKLVGIVWFVVMSYRIFVYGAQFSSKIEERFCS